MYVYGAARSPTCLLLNYLLEAPCHGLSAALQSLRDKNDRLLEIKTLFSRNKELKTKGSSQCEELLIVLEDSVFTAYFHRKQSPLVIYFIFAEEKSEQIYLLAKTPFLFLNENRRLSNTYLKFIFLHI